MGDSTVFSECNPTRSRSGAGTVTRIRLENFMCHSNLQIELCPWVNFITGQNGSGKSAILTALCIAFGSRAKGTQRASTLKDFIKTGCSYAVVEVEVKNEGDEAFKPEIYGDAIIIERRINQSTSSTVLKDFQGKKVASRKEELRELIEHFNIDVENPCVIMSQDKSREFLHSGNDRDKFKFFFKATLLQQVNDLLQSIYEQLKSTNAFVDELEATIKPIEKELAELQVKIKNMEHIEEISQQVQQLKKKLAWSWVYDVDKQIEGQRVKIGQLKDRIPTCQARIDRNLVKVDSLRDLLAKKKAKIANMMQTASEVREKQDQLQHLVSLATKQKLELDEEHRRATNHIQKLLKSLRSLEQEVQYIQEQHAQNTQAEESEIEERLKELEYMVNAANATVIRLKKDESELSESVSMRMAEIRKITEEIESCEKKEYEMRTTIRQFRQHKTNKVTAFGGERVIHLLQTIERHHQRFHKPPIGPIGAHLTLHNGDRWAPAVENAIGKLLNAFIVTNHSDSLLLRGYAREARYNNLQIIIYDFSRPRLIIPSHMLPQTSSPTTLSVLRSENDTVLNVLVDMGSAERQVLVEDYDVGKAVAFDRKIQNLKEVYTLDGYKMFSRGSVQTVLPPNKKARTGRLCSSYDDQIKDLEQDASHVRKKAEESRKRKRDSEANLQNLQRDLKNAKERCLNAERELVSKNLAVRDLKKSYATESSLVPATNVDELHEEISKIQGQIQEKEASLEMLQNSRNVAEEKASELKLAFEKLCESAKEELDAYEEAEGELMKIEKDLQSAETEKAHYEGVMTNKVLPDIEAAEAHYQELEENRKESCRKASIICPESDIEALGGRDRSTPEQLSAQLNRLNQRLQHESQRYSDSIDDLRMLYEKKQRKILKKQQMYKGFREKLEACKRALDLRWNKFQRNSTLLKRQLTWNFNGHLGKKGISGNIKVSYEEKTLRVEVKMPQDASSSTVRDTRGLSGGERSFSTLCFALALHEMTEAPFRAMDEFDVFMDAVSRKISLDTLVDFALAQGSQWIFITPHDISMVKQGERIKKQQMAAPRS
ncbi:structural maintenance of chromosomes protein 6B [Ricinus communis]|uniref:Structural maintenance of chromosomes 6 smc6, putative n=1 Tax=Ricinus communis TaxID=3988 RepID=B9R9U6_RICCO|nr:structural maintenance of chromosomes protein 6B [Ricinus communis]XP_048228795.1 structural maintenance of chromosomes protein 6B [Ricinus communis]XP_048228796.1 structural maintenance of chromosomes protein 6B [Ricinus communis]EEF51573.1 structural maintenance of chromosomes 6 smc6, putative [Ricinus communis]|eukprot:XP_002510971.1 structural maintenance of chromosomes protein 6B [Ricinus communis]